MVGRFCEPRRLSGLTQTPGNLKPTSLILALRLRCLVDFGRAVHQDRRLKGDESQTHHPAEDSPERQPIKDKTRGQRVTQRPRRILRTKSSV